MANVYERIYFLIKEREATLRSYTILDQIKPILGERKHAHLSHKMELIFP